ncbi:acetyl-CoA acetyltransferase [Pseudonocardia kujensis]|uniref:acetyl-CoA acetyltransferase n=1 Tax=Pseudonocardia kujensis TaxID=1128675 RepID=UPI001E2C9EBF|nr:acetyl-CoA acetyltransferase [Pseudonocardia kujensis]MCE0764089.1 acetyl-CoA acetyltransferase [Pseudonocardia kujensis]
MSISRKVAIVGAAESDVFESDGRSPVGLMAQAIARALEQAGLQKSDVDGLFSASAYYYMPVLNLTEYLGIHPRHADSSTIGGCSFVSHIQHAAAAINAGLCEVAVVAYGSTQRTDGRRLVSIAEPSPYELPYGLIYPISSFGLIAQRHMAQYGTTSEQLAEIAVAAREWAMLNPRARYKQPLTVDDVLSSPLISSPLHKLDCCLVTDGGGAFVLTSSERARDLTPKPVYVEGTGEAINHRYVSGMPDLTTTEAVHSSRRALQMSGRKLSEMDTIHLYDAFTISALIQLEDIGFCAKGEGGAFVEGGRLAPGGSLALNTNGGGLSYCHPGMLGMFEVIEAVRQLRGEAGERQVPNASTSLVHGMGATLAAHATAVLSTEDW